MKQTNVKPASGKLGILVVGCGAVSTTFMTGVLLTRKGLGKPVGSFTQYDKIRVGKGDSKKYLSYYSVFPLFFLVHILKLFSLPETPAPLKSGTYSSEALRRSCT